MSGHIFINSFSRRANRFAAKYGPGGAKMSLTSKKKERILKKKGVEMPVIDRWRYGNLTPAAPRGWRLAPPRYWGRVGLCWVLDNSHGGSHVVVSSPTPPHPPIKHRHNCRHVLGQHTCKQRTHTHTRKSITRQNACLFKTR